MTEHEKFLLERKRSLKGGIIAVACLVALLGLPVAVGHFVLSPAQAKQVSAE